MKKLLFAVIFGLCISNVQAVTFMGLGTLSCGKYIKDKESKEIVHALNISWVVGFLSGAVSTSGNDVLKGTDIYAIEGVVTKYCQENPLKNLSDASNNVFLRLLMK